MLYELALVAVLVAGGYWGLYFLRAASFRTYGAMLAGAAGLCGIALAGRHEEVAAAGIAGAIGVGAGTCLLVLGPMVRTFARRAAADERFGLAQRLLELADVLAPGSGVREDKALLGAMRELRDGHIERTIDALVAAKERVPAEARLAIDERIATLYLAAYRWDDAIAHAETHLFDKLPADAAPAAGSLRRALGITPPVYIELIGAYGYTGDLDRAASMLARLETVCAGRDDAAIWLHRGRTAFLALAGRLDAVQSLVEPRRSRHMNAAARSYWIAVAHERRGETVAAEAAYTRARNRSRGRPRALIDKALARVQAATPVALGPTATEVVAQVEATPPPAVTMSPRAQGHRATKLLVASLLVTASAIAITIGDTSDFGVLVRAGAMVRGLIDAGEWWRGITCIFVHAGSVHLLVNVIGLWFIGRLAEEVLGTWRVLCLFALAGLGGAAASYFAAPAAASAGASGAMFGLLGATFVELTWQRRHHRGTWTRAVWGMLAVVVVAQLGVDAAEPMTDQWAHGGGLVTGAVFAFVFSPHARWKNIAVHVARVVAVAFFGVALTAGVMVARTSMADSLARDRSSLVDVVHPTDPQQTVIENTIAEERRNGDRIVLAVDRLVPLPPGWTGAELVHTHTDALDNEQIFRIIIAARPDGEAVLVETPESVARAAPAFFTQLLSRQ